MTAMTVEEARLSFQVAAERKGNDIARQVLKKSQPGWGFSLMWGWDIDP